MFWTDKAVVSLFNICVQGKQVHMDERISVWPV